jgi:hypothetical protein
MLLGPLFSSCENHKKLTFLAHPGITVNSQSNWTIYGKRTNKQNYNMVGNGRYGNIQEALHAPEWEAK